MEDDVIIFPGHGAGSQCGKNMGPEKFSTIGKEKKTNYALQVEGKAAFVEAVTEGLTAPPQYFPKNAAINKHGYDSIDDILQKSNNPLSPLQFAKQMAKPEVIVIDTRHYDQFADGFIPGSINIGLAGTFAVWVGTLVIDLNTPILLVTEVGKEKETTLRLARVGYENVVGYLDGGFESWKEEYENCSTIEGTLPEFKYEMHGKSILDVRNKSEYDDGHIDGAINIPLGEIQNRLSELDPNETYYVHCKSGYRSKTACSILIKNGFDNVIDVIGGYDGIYGETTTCSVAGKMAMK